MKLVSKGEWVLLSKLDISNGFWRIILKVNGYFNFSCVIPQSMKEPVRVVIPSAIQMVWVKIPGYFYCTIEAIRDFINHHICIKT